MRQLVGVSDYVTGRGNFGVNMERSTITNGDFVALYLKLHETIELPFRVVSGMGAGIGVLDGMHIPQTEEEVLVFFSSVV